MFAPGSIFIFRHRVCPRLPRPLSEICLALSMRHPPVQNGCDSVGENVCFVHSSSSVCLDRVEFSIFVVVFACARLRVRACEQDMIGGVCASSVCASLMCTWS